MIVSELPMTHFCPWEIAATGRFLLLVVITYIGVLMRSMGLAAFFLLVILAFFMAGAVDGVSVPADASSVPATGVSFLFFLFFFAVMPGLTSTRMTLIPLLAFSVTRHSGKKETQEAADAEVASAATDLVMTALPTVLGT